MNVVDVVRSVAGRGGRRVASLGAASGAALVAAEHRRGVGVDDGVGVGVGGSRRAAAPLEPPPLRPGAPAGAAARRRRPAPRRPPLRRRRPLEPPSDRVRFSFVYFLITKNKNKQTSKQIIIFLLPAAIGPIKPSKIHFVGYPQVF